MGMTKLSEIINELSVPACEVLAGMPGARIGTVVPREPAGVGGGGGGGGGRGGGGGSERWADHPGFCGGREASARAPGGDVRMSAWDLGPDGWWLPPGRAPRVYVPATRPRVPMCQALKGGLS